MSVMTQIDKSRLNAAVRYCGMNGAYDISRADAQQCSSGESDIWGFSLPKYLKEFRKVSFVEQKPMQKYSWAALPRQKRNI